MSKSILLITLFFVVGFISAQQKESIIILFESGVGKDKALGMGKDKKLYLYPRIHADYFVLDTMAEIKVSFRDIEMKLISKAEANKKVHEYLEVKALDFEKQTGLKGNIIRNSPYNFDEYFAEIFIYEKIDDEYGYLYTVSWKYAIQ